MNKRNFIKGLLGLSLLPVITTNAVVSKNSVGGLIC